MGLMNVSADLELPGPSFMVDGHADLKCLAGHPHPFWFQHCDLSSSLFFFSGEQAKMSVSKSSYGNLSWDLPLGHIWLQLVWLNTVVWWSHLCTSCRVAPDSATEYQQFSLPHSFTLDVRTDISSWQIFPLLLSVDPDHLATGDSNEIPRETDVRWYFLSRNYYHRFCDG